MNILILEEWVNLTRSLGFSHLNNALAWHQISLIWWHKYANYLCIIAICHWITLSSMKGLIPQKIFWIFKYSTPPEILWLGCNVVLVLVVVMGDGRQWWTVVMRRNYVVQSWNFSCASKWMKCHARELIFWHGWYYMTNYETYIPHTRDFWEDTTTYKFTQAYHSYEVIR